MGGDFHGNIAHFALQKLHIRPTELLEMEREEYAFIVASVQLRQEAEEKEAGATKRNARKGMKR